MKGLYLALVLSVACSRSEAPLPQAQGISSQPAVRVERATHAVIVWGRDVKGRSVSLWLEKGPEGELQAEHSHGTLVAVQNRLWYWATRSEQLTAQLECAFLDPDKREAIGIFAELREVTERKTIRVVDPDMAGAKDAAEFRESVWLEGSVGPLLFVHRATYVYGCGAHGSTNHEFFVFDALHERATTLYDDSELFTIERRLRPEALSRLSERSNTLFSPELTHTLLRPSFDSSGALRIEHQFTGDSCFACSDQRWSSYTVSTRMTSPTLPPELIPYANTAREPVRWVYAHYPDLEVLGISEAEPALKLDFLRTQKHPAPFESRPGPIYPHTPQSAHQLRAIEGGKTSEKSSEGGSPPEL